VDILVGHSPASWQQYDYRDNALSEAAKGGHEGCVFAMLESPAARGLWEPADVADALNDIAGMGSVNCLHLLFERFPWLADKTAKEWDRGVYEGNYSFDAARQAAVAGSVDCLRELWSKEGLVDKDRFGGQALAGAASAGKGDCVAWVADACGRLGHIDYRVALINAAENGHAEVAMALLDRAQANGLWRDGEDSVVLALWRAAKEGRVAVVEALMERCDPLAFESYSGLTSLMVAAEAGRVDCVRLLLRAGGAALRDFKGVDSLMRASASGSVDCVSALSGSCSGHWVDDAGRDALMHAAMPGRHEALAALLPWSDPLRADNDGATALMWAAKKGSAKCVAALLPVSDAQAKSSLGRTALMAGAWRGNEACVKLLLDASDPLASDSKGITVSSAARKGRGLGQAVHAELTHWEEAGRERQSLRGELGESEPGESRAATKAARPRL
jgi:hypothetical protein